MRILIVHPGSGWVLSHIAKKTYEAMPHAFSLVAFNDLFKAASTPGGLSCWQVNIGPEFSGIFYLDVQNCWLPQIRNNPNLNYLLHVGMMTHLDKDSAESFRYGWEKLDGVIQMSQRYRDRFLAEGWYPPERMTVLRPGEVSHFPLKKIKIGICQRGEHVGKGRDFLPEVIKSLWPEERKCIELHFKGKGWDDAFEGKAFRGALFFGGDKPETWYSGSYHGVSAFSYASEDAKSYPAFFEKLDYYMIVSLWEGGPLGLLEALATGLPVISSEVGWVPEFKRIAHLYPAGDVDALAIILTEIAERRLLRRAEVEGMSYKSYAEGVLEFFEKLRGMK